MVAQFEKWRQCAPGRSLGPLEKTRAFGMTQALGRVRRRFKLRAYADVSMPERVHLLLGEPQEDASRTAPLKPKDGLNGPPTVEWDTRPPPITKINKWHFIS